MISRIQSYMPKVVSFLGKVDHATLREKAVRHAKFDPSYDDMPIMRKYLTEDEFVKVKSRTPELRSHEIKNEFGNGTHFVDYTEEELKEEFKQLCKKGEPPTLLDIETQIRKSQARAGLPGYVVCPQRIYRDEQYQKMQDEEKII